MKVRSKRAKIPEGASAVSAERRIGAAQPNLTREQILAAAAWLIVSRGYAACTMRAVADEVQIKAGSLYYHFTSKEQIITEILNSGIEMLTDQVRRTLDALSADATFAERIEAAIETHVASMSDRDAVLMQVYEHLPPVLKRESSATRKSYAKVWFDLFNEGIKRGEVASDLNLEIFVPYFLGGLNRVPEWFNSVRSDNKRVAHLAATVLLEGVAVARA